MENKLITRSGFLVKSLLFGLILLLASATESFAQYIQIEVDTSTGIMQMKVYADAAATTSSTYSGNVNYRTVDQLGCYGDLTYHNRTMTVDDFNASNFPANGTYTNMRYCEGIGHVEDILDTLVDLLSGSGYNIATNPIVYF